MPSLDAIELPLPWGPVIRGFRWGEGSDTLFLLHEPGSDIDAWGMLPATLAHVLQVKTVALDLPGHGLSDDPWDPVRLPDLLRELSIGVRVTDDGTLPSAPYALPSLQRNGRPSPDFSVSQSQSERRPGGEASRRKNCDYPDSKLSSNPNRRFVIAAGIAATSALTLASELELTGLVFFTPEAPNAGWTPPRSPTIPKLFVAGSMVGNDLETARRLSTTCGGWSVVTALPVAARGTALLTSAWGKQLA